MDLGISWEMGRFVLKSSMLVQIVSNAMSTMPLALKLKYPAIGNVG